MDLRPGHPAICIENTGKAHLRGYRCRDCEAVFDSPTLACRSCGKRDTLAAERMSGRGKLWSWSVVHRSYPGIEVPFVSAIVDLDEGLTVKATLRGIAGETLRPGLPVAAVFDNAGGARDAAGLPFVGFHFVPAGEPS